MNLWDLQVNESAVVDNISLEQSSKLSINFNELGIKKNSTITCLHKTIFGGPRVYQVEGLTCTLCEQGASKILIHM